MKPYRFHEFNPSQHNLLSSLGGVMREGRHLLNIQGYSQHMLKKWNLRTLSTASWIQTLTDDELFHLCPSHLQAPLKRHMMKGPRPFNAHKIKLFAQGPSTRPPTPTTSKVTHSRSKTLLLWSRPRQDIPICRQENNITTWDTTAHTTTNVEKTSDR